MMMSSESRAAAQLGLFGLALGCAILAFAWAGDRLGGETRGAEAVGAVHLLDINEAPAWEIALVPGIGEKKAGQIVDYRYRAGSFSSFEDLESVPGIGPELRARLERHCLPLVPPPDPGQAPTDIDECKR